MLVLDYDPNNNLTDYLARDLDVELIEEANVYYFLRRKRPITECIHHVQGLDLVPACLMLHSASIEQAQNPAELLSVKSILITLWYDYAVIDTALSREYSTQAGLFAADVVLTPLTHSRWNILAVKLLEKNWMWLRNPRVFARGSPPALP